jgi:fatty-acyl-CoA synthase
MDTAAAQVPGRPVSYEPLTPVSFLDRSAQVYPDRVAVVDEGRRHTYRQLHDRALRQAGALAGMGVGPGDRVAVLAANGSLLLEAHYGVPYAGGVLVALNTRLTAAELTGIIDHCGARVLMHSADLGELARAVQAGAASPVRLIAAGPEYEALLRGAPARRREVTDERGLLALNYTSGTTGTPKGVMYHHRGAYLQSLAMVSHFRLGSDASYLWTLPMFHCNGWCFTWAVTAAGGTHVCLPRADPEQVWAMIQAEGVTHLCAAPTVLTSLVSHPAAAAGPSRRIVAATGGAPPAPRLLEDCAAVGLDVTHLYGLTETFGPLAICDWRSEWNVLPVAEQARRRARQGVGNVVACAIRVVTGEGEDVPADGTSMGEIAVRGNNVMLGYFNDPEATAAAIPDGWFRTGDLAVVHPDGYLEIRDRKKDVIISGGENISSVEVEAALSAHPQVLEAAVVAVADPRWGERPVAWVTLREPGAVSAEELREHVRARLAGYKVPDRIYFGVLPKTSTGKIQKFALRQRAAAEVRTAGGEPVS